MENNQFVTDAELIAWMNNSLSQLDMILVSKFNDYKLTAVATTAAAATGIISLPSDFLKFRGLDVQYSPSDPDGYEKVRPFEFTQRNDRPYPMMSGPAGYGPYMMRYRLQGSSIYIRPVAIAAQWPYRLWYTPDFVPLVNVTDTLQSYMDSQAWFEYAVVDCAVKVLAKQDLDPMTFMAQKQELKEMIISLSAPNRDAGEPRAMVDTRGCNFGGGYGWDW
jgi:hypothetical protein